MNVLDRYTATGGYLEGHFLLASGRHSPKFLQSTTVMQHPEHVIYFGEEIAKKLNETLDGVKPDFVIGPAMGGIVLAFTTATGLGTRALFAEKDGQGGMFLREAFKINKGETFVAVEDVVTTGGSLKKAITAAEKAGATCIGLGCIIDRGLADFGDLPFTSLDTVEFPTYTPEECPLCAKNIILEDV